MNMKYLVTAEEMRRYDTNTIERLGIPAMVLMERAALAAAEAVEAHCRGLAENQDRTVLILAGVGNNGGDGLALARLLCDSRAKYQVEVWVAGETERASGQWRQQREILRNYPVEFCTKPARREYTVIIDALFGVGLSREISGEYQEALELFNTLSGYKIALDLPSGINSDNGSVCGCAAAVDMTVAFGFCKRGLMLYPGCQYAGRVETASAGITERSFFGELPGMFVCEENPAGLMPERKRDGNKGTFGKVLLIAGSHNMAGAAVLSARAAYRTGAGMVKVITPQENRIILQETVPEALLGTYEDLEQSLEWAGVIAAGPGLGKGSEALGALKQVLSGSGKPLVIDADGLNLLAEHSDLMEQLAACGKAGRGLVLTPHVGELARLTGISVRQLKADLARQAQIFSERIHAVVAAKDARTFVCGEGKPVCLNINGNSGMATAGSGDVLTGIIAGMMAQGRDPYTAAVCGVRLHGLAGDSSAAQHGEHGCMAGDIIGALENWKDFCLENV